MAGVRAEDQGASAVSAPGPMRAHTLTRSWFHIRPCRWHRSLQVSTPSPTPFNFQHPKSPQLRHAHTAAPWGVGTCGWHWWRRSSPPQPVAHLTSPLLPASAAQGVQRRDACAVRSGGHQAAELRGREQASAGPDRGEGGVGRREGSSAKPSPGRQPRHPPDCLGVGGSPHPQIRRAG